MRQKVQAGLLADVTKVVKSISESLFKFLDKFDDYKIEITKEQKLDNGGIKMWCKYGDTPFGMIIAPILNEKQEKTGKVNVLVRCNNKDTKFENISDLDIEKKVVELLKNEINLGAESDDTDGTEDSANSSRKLQVTLQRVTSTKESVINLTAITANYDLNEANETLETVLDNKDFLDELSEEPASFEITDNGDELDIQSTPEFDIADAMQSVKETYENFCSEARNLINTLEFYYSNFSYEEQLEVDRFIDGINSCSIDTFGCFAD